MLNVFLFSPPVAQVNPFFSLTEPQVGPEQLEEILSAFLCFTLSASSPLSDGGIKVKEEVREKKQQSERQRISAPTAALKVRLHH